MPNTRTPGPCFAISGDRSWIGPGEGREIQRIRTLDGQTRIEAAMTLDRRIVADDATVIPYGYPEYPNYFSERIGCGFVQPAIGAVDLLSLCRKGGAPASPLPSAIP
jgi:hypothetical protein